MLGFDWDDVLDLGERTLVPREEDGSHIGAAMSYTL